jgi:hypothetical protein
MGVKNELFRLKCIWLLLHCLELPRWQVIWGAAPSQPIVTIFGTFSGLADVINCAKFQNDRSRGFCWVGA